MNLQQLRYAVALADAQSFTKAAVNEYVVQSALSQQLRKLEDELGVTLFERTTRKVSPTQAGESLLPLMRQVIAGIERIKFDAQAIGGTIAGRLTVGMMEVPSESLDVAALMATFHHRYPEVTVTLRSGGSDLLVDAVRDRTLDVAIVGSNLPSATDRLTFTRLFIEPLVAVLPAGHPLGEENELRLDQLASQPFIDFPPGYGLRRETDRGFADVSRQVAFEVTRVDEVIHFVRRSLGVALLPESVAASRIGDDARLVLRPVAGAELSRQVNLVAPSKAVRTPASQAFIDCLGDHIGGGSVTTPDTLPQRCH
ncbi:LysR family transcriptional regulator [Mycobacterium paraterrae]|uniref:LysR family transcriptional regulator n=1 Tax=Mycobacterium paraterrae TaxID=577492 RepID=A0ABY3VPG4_9MYCO|nr:LysR family transcriptional regulator [Mycobacterium paraterrae]UMB71336.1 LysR family transcriptional regulator [Mycobacterium paraterrae]